MSNVSKIAAHLKRQESSQQINYPLILSTIQQALTSHMWELEQGDVSPEEKREKFLAFIIKQLDLQGYLSTEPSTQELTLRLYNDTQRYSILTEYLEDDNVEGIHINSWRDVRVRYIDGQSKKISGFYNPQHAIDIIRRLLSESHQVLDEAVPIAEASINDTIRITALRSPIVDMNVGVACYIRKLREKVFSEEEYIQSGFAVSGMLRLLQIAARRGVSTLYVGRVDSGKTTLVKHVLYSLPDELQVVTVETGAREMNLIKIVSDGTVKNNVIHLLSRESTAGEEQNITQEKLIVKMLRLNPDVAAVAEARDTEAYNAVEMSLSGHPVITTTHAGSPQQGHHRIATLARKKYAADLHTALVDARMAFPLVAFLHRTDDNVRRIMNISECWLDELEQPHYQTLWEYRVIENRRSSSGEIQVLGEYVQVNGPSAQLIERMRLYGVTDQELKSLEKEANTP